MKRKGVIAAMAGAILMTTGAVQARDTAGGRVG